MADVNCVKCGRKLDAGPKEDLTKLSVQKMASDHASKFGCDYPAANVVKVLKELRQ